jgi:threonine/homoserine/homoserine lactone efflux protein
MTLSALLVFALALVIAAGTPGRSIAALVAYVLTDGFRYVLPFLVAMWLGEALWRGDRPRGDRAPLDGCH